MSVQTVLGPAAKGWKDAEKNRIKSEGRARQEEA